ncbi:MAG: MTH1187 family thiamine-binding protein [Calditrichia bacterium]|nr:MTH1187 family thiamine-binding protein [Calditrichia bacterium]
MVLLEFSMSPFGKGESLSPYVARILDIVDKSGVTYKLTPMGTILEGEWEKVMLVVTDCFKELEKDCNRISTNIRIDYRKGSTSRMQEKIKSIENKLKKNLSK